MTMCQSGRPLVTFALFAYNQEEFIREAVEGAFSQTYQPLEIILSDDCSNDRTFEIMREMANAYRGPHSVQVRKNPANVGIAKHFDDVMRLANGLWVVVAAGDDISHPERTRACVDIASTRHDVGVVEVKCRSFSGSFYSFDRSNSFKESKNRIIRRFDSEEILTSNLTGIIGAGRAYFRPAYIRFPSLCAACPEEDTPALFRCLYGYNGIYSYGEYVYRRVHGDNLSSKSSLKRIDFSYLRYQYYLDLKTALDLNFIYSSNQNKYYELFDRYAFRKQCKIDLFSGFRKDLKFGDLIKSKHLSHKEKIYFIRKGIESRIFENE